MRKLLLMLAGMLLIATSLPAQHSRTVKGKITDDTGTVSLPGGKTGTVTDSKGEFSLSIPESTQSLKVSFVGYETKTLPITGNTVGSVILLPDSKAISEVVVVGYGTQRKKDVTGSIASVKGGAIAELPTAAQYIWPISSDELIYNKLCVDNN